MNVPPFNTGTLNISSGTVGLTTSVGNTPLVPHTLSIAGGAVLNLADGSANISTTALATINPLVKSGYDGGHWDEAGISSTAAATDSRRLTAIGVIQNNQGGSPLYNSSQTFNGVSLGASDVLLAYTYYGDTNLDGKVDGSDYSRIDNGYLQGGGLTGWFNGDFNYDGMINGSDYTLIDNAFNSQGAALTGEIAAPTAQIAATSSDIGELDSTELIEVSRAVPEPASMVVMVLGAMGILGRRRK